MHEATELLSIGLEAVIIFHLHKCKVMHTHTARVVILIAACIDRNQINANRTIIRAGHHLLFALLMGGREEDLTFQ